MAPRNFADLERRLQYLAGIADARALTPEQAHMEAWLDEQEAQRAQRTVTRRPARRRPVRIGRPARLSEPVDAMRRWWDR